MRTIKFRGRMQDNTIVYGGYSGDKYGTYITKGELIWRVAPDSVAQFTEFLDKDGAEVYEGDTLELDFSGAAKVIGDGSLIRDLETLKPTAEAKLKVEFLRGRYQLRWRTKNGCVDTGIDLYLLEVVKQFVRRCD